MHSKKLIKNRAFSSAIGLSFVAYYAVMSPYSAQAQNLDAGYVMKEMTVKERVGYVNGIVDGLAYARFLRDRPDDTSYLCVVNWYGTDTKKKWTLIRTWLKRNPDKPVPVLLHLVIRKACGE